MTRRAARVIKLIDRAKHRALGIFRSVPGGGGRLVPIDKKQLGREIAIAPDATAGAADGDLVAVEVARQGRFGLPSGSVVERLGSLKSERAVSLIAIHAHDIPHVFSRAALAEAEAARPATLGGRESVREDWRKIPFVTIDPPDAKDHDDAVYAEPDPDPRNAGGHIVSVAIADVAHYVRPGSALDRAAAERGNSVYFPDRVVPMLPERISNDLCSLRPGEDRPALAVRMVIGADGRKRSHTFHRVLIRSAARLHYEQAQLAVSGRTDEVTEPIVKPIIAPLYAAYRAVARARDERGPLDLEIPERKIMLKSDGTVDRVIMPQRLESHRLIEEFMILANVAAAETCERARVPLVYRVHDEPTAGKGQRAARIPGDARHLAAEGRHAAAGCVQPHPGAGQGPRRRAARQRSGVAHAGAGGIFAGEFRPFRPRTLRRYAHFTSPIRRYADLIVHRALIRALKLGPDGLAEGTDTGGLAGNRRQHFGGGTARHESRARNRRPADRAFPGGPHRRDFRWPHLRRDPRRPVRRARRDRRRRLCPGAHHRRRIFPLSTRRAAPSSVLRRPIGSAMR